MLHRSGASGFGYASTAHEVTDGLDLSGLTVLVTGVNSGLGLETARVLALRGARVLGAARTRDKAEIVTASLGNGALPLECELSEPASVRACVADVRALGVPLDVLMCNAGIMALPERTLRYGQELQFLTNHIGHFMLVSGLLDVLSEHARVVVLSSSAHAWAPPGGIQFDDLTLERSYSPNVAYGQSKLANLLFARGLAQRFSGTSKSANGVHPGVIATNLWRSSAALRLAMPVASLFLKDVHQGAATQCYVATHPSLAGVSGRYFVDCNEAHTSGPGRDPALAERLWEVSERIVAKV
ncbi:MAG: SDR family oxidoreductase [Myxococcales bacterium]|nr:SDR family oxidoreductase [Myxococcales bacterium]